MLGNHLLAICSPRLRNDELLNRALTDFRLGYYADALIAAEAVCRHYSTNSIPAILRAKIVQQCHPELSIKAWYNAWLYDPINPVLQDILLEVFLSSGAVNAAIELGFAFLSARCRDNTHLPLVKLLQQNNINPFGACWKSESAIEVIVFKPASCKVDEFEPQRLHLLIDNELTHLKYEVPVYGHSFKINLPQSSGTWSLALCHHQSNKPYLLSGSPLVFEKTIPTEIKKFYPVLPSNIRNTVAILIPVYGEYGLVKVCIESVLSSLLHNKTAIDVIVIDDASPDEAVSAWLISLEKSAKIKLLRNNYNLGFIESVNRGLRETAGHDVVILNADTLVQGDWLDRLKTALYSSDDIASVTPWSNNGEISSFPYIKKRSFSPTLQQLSLIDATAANLNYSGHTTNVEIPACCGFAMMIRRSVLDRIGFLDGVEMIRGYGEEFDWCLRARVAGYRHLVAVGVFVAHTGNASFRYEKTLRVHQNRKVLLARYPDYYPEFVHFIKSDPLKTARNSLSIALNQGKCEWLKSITTVNQEKQGLTATIPTALSSSCKRIAVWQYQLCAANAGKVLALARAIAMYDQSKFVLRLLVIGDESEALWHTGVVDILPPIIKQESTLFTDTALIGLTGCSMLLIDNTQIPPIDIPYVQINETFEPRTWLKNWLQEQMYYSTEESNT